MMPILGRDAIDVGEITHRKKTKNAEKYGGLYCKLNENT